jgi:MFS family permease
LIACCVAAFARLAEPQLWMMGLDIPDSLFGTAWANYRIFSNISTLVFVTLLMVGGLLGDLFGRRRLFLIGIAGFVLANVLTLVSPTPALFIVSRALMGGFGALFLPQTLAMIRVGYKDHDREIAMLTYTMVSAVGALASLLALLIEVRWGGRATVVIPMVVGAVALPLAWRMLPESRARGFPRRNEIIAAAVWSIAILALFFGLTIGWAADSLRNPVSFAAFGLALAGVVAIVVIRKLDRNPGITRRVVGVRTAYITVLLVISATLGLALASYVTRVYGYFQQVQGIGYVISGLLLLPILLGCGLALPAAIRLAGRFEPRKVIGGGLAAMGAAMVASALAQPGSPYWPLIIPMMAFGFGYLLAASAWNNTLLSAMPSGVAGVTAAISKSALSAGAAASTALGALVLVTYGGQELARRLSELGLSEDQTAVVVKAIDTFLRSGITLETVEGTPRVIGETLLMVYRDAYNFGNAAVLVTVGVASLLVGALVWPKFLWQAVRDRESEE